MLTATAGLETCFGSGFAATNPRNRYNRWVSRKNSMIADQNFGLAIGCEFRITNRYRLRKRMIDFFDPLYSQCFSILAGAVHPAHGLLPALARARGVNLPRRVGNPHPFLAEASENTLP